MGSGTRSDPSTGRAPAEVSVVPDRRHPRLTYRRDVDGLRAVAIVLVVLFHAGAGAVPGGFVGVDVFFVISGFLITGLLVDELESSGRISLSAFYARRIRRLLPVSTLVLVAAAIITAVVLPPLTHESIAGDIRSAALWVSNWHFAAGATQYMSDTQASPVLHYWSLSLEEQFYVVWPLLIVLVVRTLPRWGEMGRRRLATVLAAVLGGSLMLSLLMTSSAGPWAYFGLQTRAWELAAGAALALAAHRFSELTLPAASLLGWVGLGLVLYAALFYSRATPYPGIAAVVPVLGAALVLVSGARTRGIGPAAPLSHPATVYVGRISYGWYLWHWPLLVAAAALAPVDPADPDAGTPWTYVVVAVAISFGLAALTHRFLEDPVRRSRTLLGSRRQTFVVGAALTVTSLLAAGLAVGDEGSRPDAPVAVVAQQPAATAEAQTDAAADPSASPSTSKPVVATLAMTPAQARADDWPASDCFAGFAATAAPTSCEFGDLHGSKVVALVGDSHAAQWLPALDAAGKAHGWQVWFWAKSSCPMTEVDVWLPSYRSKYDACSAWRQNVLGRLDALPQLDLVVVARSKGYQQDLVLGSDGDIAPRSDLPALWTAGTSKLLADLGRSTTHVVLLRDTPWAAADVPDCLSAHLTTPAACAFPRDARSHLDASLAGAERTAIAAAADGGAWVRSVDPTRLVCPRSTCSVVTPKGVIVYRDGHHLTRTYSASLAKPFANLLAPSLR